ncbi:MAG: hypothetical protein Rubg2KO_15170 [Rubricoccaceae bacterium]
MSTKHDALTTHAHISGDVSLKARVLNILRTASRRTDGRPTSLTDYELAALLDVERSSINAARNQLVKDGLVTATTKRFCRHKPSNVQVNTWRPTTPAERASHAAEAASDAKARAEVQSSLFPPPAILPRMSGTNAH